MAEPQPIDENYKKLLTSISSSQSVSEEVYRTPEGFVLRFVPYLIQLLWYVEAKMLDLERNPNWERSELEGWSLVLTMRQEYLDCLAIISGNAQLEIPLNLLLPSRGSDEWFALYAFVRLSAESSHVLESPSSNNEHGECPICIEALEVGERYIKFPCHHTHWLHESCLITLASNHLEYSCPVCRKIPYDPSAV